MSWLGWSSVSGVQVGFWSSQSVVFHTPPPAARYMTLTLLGSGAATLTRPLARAFSAWPKVPVTGPGPRGVHEVGLRATGAAGRRRASENSEVLPAESVAVALN